MAYRSHLNYGVPFLVFLVGGSFALKYVTNARYEYRNLNSGGPTKEELDEIFQKQGFKVKEKQPTMEDIYEDMKNTDIDNWENVRGPRPWEEGNKLYEEAIERGKKIKEERSKGGKNSIYTL